MTWMTKFGLRSGENWLRGAEFELRFEGFWGFRVWRSEDIEVIRERLGLL